MKNVFGSAHDEDKVRGIPGEGSQRVLNKGFKVPIEKSSLGLVGGLIFLEDFGEAWEST
jgi:hypothetical protein